MKRNFEFSSYFKVFILLLISGNPLFSYEYIIKYSLPVFLTLGVACCFRVFFIGEFRRRLFIVLIVFLVSIFAQFLQFGKFYPWMVAIVLKLVLGAVIFYDLGVEFRFVYIRVMVFLAAVSLFFFVLQIVNFDYIRGLALLVPSGTDNVSSLWIHTLIATAPGRNAGMFWEPGAYQGFLNIAIFFYYIDVQRLAVFRKFDFLVLVLALVTTLSSTGYLVFFVIIAFGYLIFTRSVVSLLFSVIIGYFFYIIYISVDFLGEKISAEISSAGSADEFDPSRIGSFLFDVPYILKHPIFGNGYALETRFSDHMYVAQGVIGHSNGLSGFLASMGLWVFFWYFYWVYKAGRFVIGRFSFMFLLLLFLILFGEHFLSYPFFLGLVFFGGNRQVRRAPVL